MEKPIEGRKNRFSDVIKALKIDELKDMPCFFKDAHPWGAPEELILLAALQTYGYGNWDPITEVLNNVCKREFIPLEVQWHYNDVYWEGELAKEMQNVEIEPLKSSFIDHFADENDDILNCTDMSAHLNLPKRFLRKIGYMPLRRDFEMECKPDAELIVKRVKFIKEMDDFDKNTNLLILDTYNNKVKERYMKKKIISAYRIAECYYEMSRDKRSRSLNGADERSASFSYNTLSEMFPTCAKRNFYMNLTKDRSLLKKERKAKRKRKVSKKSNGNATLRRSARTPKPSPKKLSTEKESKDNVASGSARQLRSGKVAEEEPEDKNLTIDSASSGSESDNTDPSTYFRQTFDKIATDGTHVLFKYPWIEYLSNKERKLCVEVGLQPMQYIYYKAFLLREDLNLRQGLKPHDVLIPPDLTCQQCLEVAKFLLLIGCIKSVSIFQRLQAAEKSRK